MPIEFSLCAIYKDEESLLDEFIERHKNLFEELILVDTGSTDKSNEIVSSHKLKHYFYKWDNNFSNARNASLSYASKPYIIVLDIDEHITAESLNELKKIIQQENRDGYSLKQISFSNLNSSNNWRHISQLQPEISIVLPDNLLKISEGYITSPLIRVFKNKKGICFSGMIHEIVGESMDKNKLSSIRTEIPIFHFGWIDKKRTDLENIGKKKRYNELIKMAWETEQSAKAAYYYLIIIESPEEKMKLAFKLIKMFPKVKEFYQIMTYSAIELNQYKRGLSYADKGLKSFPDDLPLLSAKARCFNQLMQPEEALSIIENILKKDPYSFKNYLEKIKALIVLGKDEEAKKTIKNLPHGYSEIYKTELFSLLDHNIIYKKKNKFDL